MIAIECQSESNDVINIKNVETKEPIAILIFRSQISKIDRESKIKILQKLSEGIAEVLIKKSEKKTGEKEKCNCPVCRSEIEKEQIKPFNR